MTMSGTTTVTEPARAKVDDLAGPTLLEFGAAWCGYCHFIQPMLKTMLARHPRVRHLRIEDGPGRPLGRSFGIKLWPTLVFLHDGQETARLVRPVDPGAIGTALEHIDRQDAPQGTGLAEHRPGVGR